MPYQVNECNNLPLLSKLFYPWQQGTKFCWNFKRISGHLDNNLLLNKLTL